MNDTTLEIEILKLLSDNDSFRIWDNGRCHLNGFYTFDQLISIGEILKKERISSNKTS